MTLVLLGLSVLASTLPMLAMLWLVWWLDRYDREPLWLYGITFLWGAVGAIALAMAGSLFLAIPLYVLVPGAADSVTAVIVAPLIEEPSKAVFLLLVMWSRHFDNMTDGFVYGAAAGLGFGMTENFMYFAEVGATGDVGGWVATVIIRTLYSAVMHATATSIVGAALGWSQHRGWSLTIGLGFAGLVMAMAVHAFWNGMLTLDMATGHSGTFMGINLIVFPFEVAFIAVIFQLCLLDEKWTIERELAEEADSGLIPPEHPDIIASWWRRGRSWWVPRGLDHDRYVQALTTLAMRKRQASLTQDPFYLAEVRLWRARVHQLWERARAVHDGAV